MLAVADDLRSRGRVSRGFLGVEGTNATQGSGAVVETVHANGPAAGRLDHGEVIVAIDGQPVRTMAELLSRLYALGAGHRGRALGRERDPEEQPWASRSARRPDGRPGRAPPASCIGLWP